MTAVDNRHNHRLVCSEELTKNFLKHRHMSEHEKNFSRILQQHKIKPQKIMQIFRKMHGTFKLMNFTKTDLKNLRQSDNQKRIKNTDIDRAVMLMNDLQVRQPRFYYTMRIDEGNTVRSLFWTDAESRLNYALYGDFVSFDTTFSINKYNIPFAPIVGINGNGKSIVFGWALLEDQKATTFKWLLGTFIKVMGGKEPGVIITDQDAAMKKAIAVVHRNCFWHIMRNARENLAPLINEKPELEPVLVKLIYYSLTEDEFEDGWKEMLETYKISENIYLQMMYNSRKIWVLVFLKKVFCPFIKSTGRSEGINSVFMDYVMRKDRIETFLEQYQLFQEDQQCKEYKDRFNSTVLEPKYSTKHPIERHAGKIYNREIYEKFLHQIHLADAYMVKELIKDEKYIVKRIIDYDEQEYYNNSFPIEVDLKANRFDCICCKYDRDGILCCHVLRLFTQIGIYKIPENYIKQRWTKKWKEDALESMKKDKLQQQSNQTNAGTDATLTYAMMTTKSADLCANL